MSDREAFAEEKLLNTVYVGKWDELPRVNTHQCHYTLRSSSYAPLHIECETYANKLFLMFLG